MVLLSAAITLLINVIMTATLTDRGPNTLVAPVVNLFSGAIVPLAFFPDARAPVAAGSAVRRARRHPVLDLLRRDCRLERGRRDRAAVRLDRSR